MSYPPKALYLRLSAMMFIQFAVWGSWAVLIAGHMVHLGFTGRQISYVFGVRRVDFAAGCRMDRRQVDAQPVLHCSLSFCGSPDQADSSQAKAAMSA